MPPVLKVLDRSKGWIDKQQEFGVCIHNALTNYSDISWFIQTLELYKMFGAQQVFVYHRSSNISSVLDFYEKQGFVTVIPWNVTAIEKGLGNRMRYGYKRLSLQNDCVLRNIHRFKYLLMHDIDEIIVPYLHENYSAMIQSFPSRAAYRFSNAFFPLVFIDNVTVYENRTGDKDGQMLRYKPVALLATKRLYVWFGGGRWKMIIRPEKVNLMTTHSAINATSVYAVLPSEAILHHFRQGSPIYIRKNKVLKKNFLETRMYHFKDKYLARLETTERMMKKSGIAWP
ncbi:beta-1,4-galactosyltransferase galt-1-like [Lingula anatina]|uniref:Glycosyltransferase family 92 protein n=1 Tax=Lingula anatina TaxID=7574 RepID=A0A1S3JE73_LINAN|nr:beta-1,4-galactosyltransferase galt-1-like [Lingula anatina]|eukprot:XP_013408628.1 beta-1,4-galactosyltransferase galt-1-like [Lingula anatina]